MIALEITSMKNFMNRLLAGDTFDLFLLEEATISTANTYTIDGHINRDFYPAEERTAEMIPYEFQPWSEVKGLCFHLIKGKHTPLFLKLVLHLKPEITDRILREGDSVIDADHIKALVLNVKYDGSRAILTTGASYQTFVMSREPEKLWDTWLVKYLDQSGITFSSLA